MKTKFFSDFSQKLALMISLLLVSSIILSFIPAEIAPEFTSRKGRGKILAAPLQTSGNKYTEYTFHNATFSDYIVICAIDGYLTNKDDDMAWKCTFKEITDSNGMPAINFRLEKFYASGSSDMRAMAVLLPRNEFNLVYHAIFNLTDSGLEYKAYNEDTRRLPNGQTQICIQKQLVENSQNIPIVTVNLYEGGDSDQFGFDMRYDYGTQCIYMSVADATWNSVIEGQFYLVEAKAPQSGSLGSTVDENGFIVYGNSTKLLPFGYRHPTWDPTRSDTFIFNSLFRYLPDGDKDYAGYVMGNEYNENRINEGIQTKIYTNYGDPSSSFGFQTLFLQETW